MFIQTRLREQEPAGLCAVAATIAFTAPDLRERLR